jgi:uncharacterized phage-associated protein
MSAMTAKAAILEIIRKSDGEFTGKNRLQKTMYFAHLMYFGLAPDNLTDCEFTRLPQGPGLQDAENLLRELRDEVAVEWEQIHDGPYLESRYRLTARAGSSSAAVPAEAELAIQRAVDFVRDKSSSELSQYTHEYSRSWNLARKDGELLQIYLDVIPDDEFERRKKKIQEMEPMFEQVLKTLNG